uniref:3-oxoacyl-[acyl-carrier-protein] reductase n=1 Tax=Strongyloides stercoralis TaxID=6248 RepID=A0A0K0ESQ6_STRER
MNRFVDKVVIVTGGNSGIGRGTVIAFAKEKANVVIVGRNEKTLNETVDILKSYNIKEENFLVIQCDLTNEKSPKIIIEKTIDKYGKIDVLVNNAGQPGKVGLNDTSSLELYDHIFNINLRAVIMLSEAVLPYLIKTKGNIINISSIASTVPSLTKNGEFMFYGMSKAALDMYTKSLAVRTISHGVRVNSVNPGYIATPIFSKLSSDNKSVVTSEDPTIEMNDFINSTVPMKRFGTAEEIANFITFIASDQASFNTGSINYVDGGFLVRPVSE